MRVQDLFEDDDIEAQIANLQRRIKQAQDRAEFADFADRERREIASYQSQIEQLRRQQRLQSGEEIETKITIPDDVSTEVMTKVRDMWNSSGGSVPWKTLYGQQPNTIDVIVRGNPEWRDRGISVRELVQFLKRYEI